MARSQTEFIAVGGGEMAESEEVLEHIFEYAEKCKDPRMVVMTVATSDENGANEKYEALFRKRNIRHVLMVNVSQRDEAFLETSVKKVEQADMIFFTGGDQKHIPALLGGSPVDIALKKRANEGILLAGTSAGAAMMSGSMIASGTSSRAPRVGTVELSPGMNFIPETIIDTHFSQRGRHGRLLTAIAHDPQLLGIGIDERTAMVLKGKDMKVIGEGSVTIIDGTTMSYSDLVYKKDDDTVGIFDVSVHVLPAGFRYDIPNRKPKAPAPRSRSAGR